MARTREAPEQVRIDRRGFLRRFGTAGAGIAVLSQVPGLAWAAKGGRRKIYRLSARGHTACNACRAHGAHTYYRNRPAADRTRAHLGCTCTIKTQWIDAATHAAYFDFPQGPPRDAFDDRG